MSFLFPNYLFALGLMAVPVIIHYFNFRRPKRVLFTNIKFLKEVKSFSNARNKLKNILVMLMRMLFIAAVVLAFAKPRFSEDGQAPVSGNAGHISVYFDNSYSMQAEADSRRLFDLGLAYIDKLSANTPDNALFHFTDNGFAGSPGSFIEKSKLAERLAGEGFSPSGKTLADVYERQAGILNKEAPQGGGILWVSDFQKNSVGSLENLQIDTLNSFYLVPLQPNTEANLYIDSVWQESPFVKPQEINAVFARVRNTGGKEAQGKTLKLMVDGVMMASVAVDVPANSAQTVSLSFSLNEGGAKKCSARLEDYPVVFDDEYFFVLQVAPTVNIIHIGGGEGTFVQDVYSNEPYFKITTFKSTAIDYSALSTADLIVAESLDEIDPSLSVALQKALSEGRSVMLFPGEKADAKTYGAFTGLSVSQSGLKADLVKFGQKISAPATGNGFFEGVFEKLQPDMSMPTAVPLLSWNGTGEHILKFQNGQPFLTAFDRGAAKLYCAASPLAGAFSDFANHSLFVPVMYKIALRSKKASGKNAYTFEERFAEIPYEGQGKQDIFKLKNEKNEFIPVQRLVAGKIIVEIPETGLESGCYDLTNGKQTAGALAFNYGKKESNLEAYTPAEIKKAFEGRKNVKVFEQADEDAFVKQFQDQKAGGQLWRYFVVLALAALLAETLLIRFWKR